MGCMKMGVCLKEELLQVALGFLSSFLLSPRRGRRGLGQEKREPHTKFNNEVMTQTFLHKFIKSLENHNELKKPVQGQLSYILVTGRKYLFY